MYGKLLKFLDQESDITHNEVVSSRINCLDDFKPIRNIKYDKDRYEALIEKYKNYIWAAYLINVERDINEDYEEVFPDTDDETRDILRRESIVGDYIRCAYLANPADKVYNFAFDDAEIFISDCYKYPDEGWDEVRQKLYRESPKKLFHKRDYTKYYERVAFEEECIEYYNKGLEYYKSNLNWAKENIEKFKKELLEDDYIPNKYKRFFVVNYDKLLHLNEKVCTVENIHTLPDQMAYDIRWENEQRRQAAEREERSAIKDLNYMYNQIQNQLVEMRHEQERQAEEAKWKIDYMKCRYCAYEKTCHKNSCHFCHK